MYVRCAVWVPWREMDFFAGAVFYHMLKNCYEIADWAIAGNRLPDLGECLWFYNPFSSKCRNNFPSNVGYWQTRIGDHCFYNPTNAYYST